MRRFLRSALPAWLMLGALGLSLVVVHFAADDAEVETVMLQRVKQARFMSLMKAEGPIKEGESPPFDESLDPPEAACDMQKLRDCLGGMQALWAQQPQLKNINDENSASSSMFCQKMHVPFECACQACDEKKMTASWKYKFWTADGPAFQIFAQMKVEARCNQLQDAGALSLPGGHGCHQLYANLCQAKFDQHFCPRILKGPESRFGLAQNLENDDTKYVDNNKVCKGDHELELEEQCKMDLKKTLDPRSNFCEPNHKYLKCICDACEHDVEKRVDNAPRFRKCSSLKELIAKTPTESCSAWYQDECETPLDKDYCEKIVGSKAWLRNQPKEVPKQITWEEDGMKWRTYCKTVVLPLTSNPSALDANLGPGWEDWCRQMLTAQGEDASKDEGIVPFGEGVHGHQRLPVSGLPAPRSYDNEDPALQYFNTASS